MPTEQEIIATHKALHDELEHRYYTLHELTKEEFDAQHGQIWEDMTAELIAEGYREPPREYPLHQDRVGQILATSPDVITMPQIWELLRIYAEALGYPPP